MTPVHRHASWPVALIVLAAALVVGVLTSSSSTGSPVPLRWPAAALSVAAIVFSPRPRWGAVTALVGVVTLVANLLAGRDAALSTWFAAGCALEAAVAAAVLGWGRGGQMPRLRSQEDFRRVLVAAVLGGVTAAGVVAGALTVTGDHDFLHVLAATFGAHSSAILVAAPAALTLLDRHRHDRWLEVALQVGATVVVTLVVFAPEQDLGLAFLVLPFLVWGALRFDVRTVAFETAGFAALVTYLTGIGYGPFANLLVERVGSEDVMNGIRQAFLLCAVVLTLPLAIAVQQRGQLLRRVLADERLFRRNFTQSLVGMAILQQRGPSLTIVDINDTAARILAGERELLLGRTLDSVVVAEGGIPAAITRARAEGPHGWRGHAEVVARPGSQVDMAVSLLGDDDEVVYSVQLLDVTAERMARRRIEAAEKLTSATLDTTACVVLLTDLDGCIIRVNAATTDITGYAASELLGHRVWDTGLAPADPADLQALVLWPNRSGSPETSERDLVTKGGEKLRVVWSSNVVLDDDGQPTYVVMTGIDVTAERTTAGLLNHLIQATSTTALVGIDTVGRITVFNSGAQHMLGYRPDEIVGQPFTRLLDADELLERTEACTVEEAFAGLVSQLREDGEAQARDWTWVTSEGDTSVVSMTLSVAQDAFASQVGFLCVGRDVTEQRANQELLVAALDTERRAVERLQALDTAKDEFVSTVSHELRTPVTSIVGYTEMLTDGSLVDPDPAQLPLLRTIARNSQRLIVICNDLLLLSGLDSDSVPWERTSVDLSSSLPSAEEAVRALLIGRRLDVAFDIPDRPVVVSGDKQHLDRVLLNLLSNAVKFTEDGGSILCRLESDGRDAILTVRDTGIGIPVEEQGQLFQKFFRSSTAQKRAIQGTGLGLSIVAAIVSGHGGRISTESAHLEGTTFTVRIPLAGRR